MVALLKQKAKITIDRKPRTKYELADILKKRKLNESSLAESFVQPQADDEKKGEAKDPKKIKPHVVEKYDVNMNTQK